MKVARAALLCGCLASVSSRVAAQCGDEACVKVSPNLSSVTTQQSALLDATLTSLLGLPAGDDVDLTLADHQALATTNVDLAGLLHALNQDAASALSLPGSLSRLLTAAAAQATGQGSSAAATALQKLLTQSASVNTENVTLGRLIQVDTRSGPLANNTINLLDLVTGSASLFNEGHVASLRNVSLNLAELGLGNSSLATLSALVIAPARMVCGPTGTQFLSASVRLRIHLDLSGPGVDLTVPGLAAVKLNLTKLDLVAAIGRASGSITAIDATLRALTVQATPGVAELFLGTVSDANVLDRSTPIDPASELTPTVIGGLNLQLALLNATASVSAKSYVRGASPTASTLQFAAPYPRTQTASSSASFATNLVSSLLANLELTVGAYSSNLGLLGTALDTLVDNVLGTVTAALRSSADSNPLKAVLTPLLRVAIDPLLALLGIELGAVAITASVPYEVGAGASCNDNLYCTVNDTCNGSGLCSGSARTCSDGLACTTDVCDEAVRSCVSTVTASCNDSSTCSDASGCAAGCDSDRDGLRDCHERDPEARDHDGDGTPDWQDPDDDGDGVPTREEHADPNGDGDPRDARSLDEDGTPDYLDTDDDDDGRSTQRERSDGEQHGRDVDGDGDDNWYDFDSDDDEATDAAENYGGGDSNSDGIPDYVQPSVQPADDDDDGLPTQVECPSGVASCADSDGDGVRDGDDPDDDGDGVLTRLELRRGQRRDTDGDGSYDHLDPDDDGDIVPTRDEQPDPNRDGDPSDARDSDDDGKPDYLDADDDDDGTPTAQEGRSDANGNGIPDYLEGSTGGAPDAASGPRTDGGVRDAALGPVDARAAEDAGAKRGGDGGCALTDRNDGLGSGALWVLAALGGVPWRRRKR